MAEGSDVDYWTLVTILGPIILLGIIAWAILRNKKSSAASRERTEQATHDLYQEEQRAHENDKSSGL